MAKFKSVAIQHEAEKAFGKRLAAKLAGRAVAAARKLLSPLTLQANDAFLHIAEHFQEFPLNNKDAHSVFLSHYQQPEELEKLIRQAMNSPGTEPMLTKTDNGSWAVVIQTFLGDACPIGYSIKKGKEGQLQRECCYLCVIVDLNGNLITAYPVVNYELPSGRTPLAKGISAWISRGFLYIPDPKWVSGILSSKMLIAAGTIGVLALLVWGIRSALETAKQPDESGGQQANTADPRFGITMSEITNLLPKDSDGVVNWHEWVVQMRVATQQWDHTTLAWFEELRDKDRTPAKDKNPKIEEAVTAFRKAIALKPDSAEEYVAFGGVLMREGRTKEAMWIFAHAFQQDPDFPSLSFGRPLSEPIPYHLGINLANQEWDIANVAKANQLLDQTPNGLRGFEHRFLSQKILSGEVDNGKGKPAPIVVSDPLADFQAVSRIGVGMYPNTPSNKTRTEYWRCQR